MARRLEARRGGELVGTRGGRKSLAGDEALAKLARRINEEHRQVELSLKTGLMRALRVGNLLREAKARVGHGLWLAWVEAATDLSRRAAQRYLWIARRLPKVPNAQLVSHLKQCEVLRLPVARGDSAKEVAGEGSRADVVEGIERAEGALVEVLAAGEPGGERDQDGGAEGGRPRGEDGRRAVAAGDVQALAAEVRRMIAEWPRGLVQRRALAACFEALAREVKRSIAAAG